MLLFFMAQTLLKKAAAALLRGGLPLLAHIRGAARFLGACAPRRLKFFEIFFAPAWPKPLKRPEGSQVFSFRFSRG
jgi:hypothetical protein